MVDEKEGMALIPVDDERINVGIIGLIEKFNIQYFKYSHDGIFIKEEDLIFLMETIDELNKFKQTTMQNAGENIFGW